MPEKQTKLFLESKAKCGIQSVFTLLSSDVSSSSAPLHHNHHAAPTQTREITQLAVQTRLAPKPVWVGI